MNISFSGIKTPYRTNQADIYPIAKDISQADITKSLHNMADENLLGSGFNGEVYAYGKDLVIKRSKKNPLIKESLLKEAKKLNMLYHLRQEKGINLENSQVGIACFNFHNGSSYLISSRVKGKEVHCTDNPFTKRNLSSLMKILASLDKGSKRYGKLMVYDLNTGNFRITPNQAGILDVEYMHGEKYKDLIKKIVTDRYDRRNPHISDTSYLPSNVRSFEWGSLQYYLKDLSNEEAQKVFSDYLHIKSNYHNDMADYYLQNSEKSMYPSFFTDLSATEKVHARLLGKKKIDKDIVLSEAIKIQMANYIFITCGSCNGFHNKLNIPQIVKYYEKGIKYFEDELTKAKITNDNDRITYYTNCVDIFNSWSDIRNFSKKINSNQRKRLWDVREKTLDEKVL